MKFIEKIIDDQVKRWQKMNTMQGRNITTRPVITLSREHGSGGSIIARQVADQLGLDFFHREIIHKMAESANISERLMKLIDEKGMSLLDDWLCTLIYEKHLWPDQYLRHLIKVIGAIGRRGGAVIVGRGASFILPPENNLRVRVVAPLETRIQRVAYVFKLSYDEAKRRVLKSDSERNNFVKKYFHKDVADIVNYDLIINTEIIGIDAAVNAIKGALEVVPTFQKTGMAQILQAAKGESELFHNQSLTTQEMRDERLS